MPSESPDCALLELHSCIHKGVGFGVRDIKKISAASFPASCWNSYNLKERLCKNDNSVNKTSLAIPLTLGRGDNDCVFIFWGDIVL